MLMVLGVLFMVFVYAVIVAGGLMAVPPGYDEFGNKLEDFEKSEEKWNK